MRPLSHTLRRLDWPLVAATLALSTLGALFVASAGGPAGKQVIWIAGGCAISLATISIDYRSLVRQMPWIYVLMLGALIAVMFTRPVNGARSWFQVGPFSIQPSEPMKIVTICTVAYALMYHENYKRFTGLVTPLFLVLLPMGLILRQPDMGTAMTFIPMAFAILLAAGARAKHLAALSAIGLAGMIVLYLFVMSDVQKRRISAWLDPGQYRMREAYQVINSKIAFGAGGISGAGYGRGVVTQSHRIPENETDFIFAAVGEEWGFLGTMGVLALFVLFFLIALNIALRTRETAGRIIAAGCIGLLAGQVFINIGVASGLLPCTGLTLPFFSYGGSSMLSSFLAAAMLANVGIYGTDQPAGVMSRLPT
jgi:rod shape determining protein RodA